MFSGHTLGLYEVGRYVTNVRSWFQYALDVTVVCFRWHVGVRWIIYNLPFVVCCGCLRLGFVLNLQLMYISLPFHIHFKENRSYILTLSGSFCKSTPNSILDKHFRNAFDETCSSSYKMHVAYKISWDSRDLPFRKTRSCLFFNLLRNKKEHRLLFQQTNQSITGICQYDSY